MAILRRSRAWNAEHSITGMLLYVDGNIMQALEGPVDSIAELEGQIRGDPRHKDMTVMIKEPIAQRQFSGWSMGFQEGLDLSAPDLEAVSDFLRNARDPDFNCGIALRLLTSFRKNMVIDRYGSNNVVTSPSIKLS